VNRDQEDFRDFLVFRDQLDCRVLPGQRAAKEIQVLKVGWGIKVKRVREDWQVCRALLVRQEMRDSRDHRVGTYQTAATLC